MHRRYIDAVRRHAAMRLDQAWALSTRRVVRPRAVGRGDATRLALASVNFSTTHFVKLMLLTLSGQERLGLIQRIVLVDNGSRDGGPPFLRELDRRVPRLHLVERTRFLHHAAGLRAAVRALDRLDARDPEPASHILFCDPDIVFRSPTAIASVAEVAQRQAADLVGELRPRRGAEPSIQASFVAVSREALARPDVRPFVHHGSPAYWLQQSIWRAGLVVAHFPSNHGGYVLHRGRAGVAAAGRHRRWHPYASVPRSAPHFMGVPDGQSIWAQVEVDHARLVHPSHEDDLLDHLEHSLKVLGTDAMT